MFAGLVLASVTFCPADCCPASESRARAALALAAPAPCPAQKTFPAPAPRQPATPAGPPVLYYYYPAPTYSAPVYRQPARFPIRFRGGCRSGG